jgi:hypothetical protein
VEKYTFHGEVAKTPNPARQNALSQRGVDEFHHCIARIPKCYQQILAHAL